MNSASPEVRQILAPVQQSPGQDPAERTPTRADREAAVQDAVSGRLMVQSTQARAVVRRVDGRCAGPRPRGTDRVGESEPPVQRGHPVTSRFRRRPARRPIRRCGPATRCDYPEIWLDEPLRDDAVASERGGKTRLLSLVVREVSAVRGAVPVAGGTPGGTDLEEAPAEVADCTDACSGTDRYVTFCVRRLVALRAVRVVSVLRPQRMDHSEESLCRA